MPAAPALGATLHADAALLRPFQEGGVWAYRGTLTARTGATPVSYQTQTRHTGATAAGAAEATSNAGNAGAEAQQMTLSGGEIASSESVSFSGKGAPEVVRIIELRSPVRVGDQYTMLDRRYTDTTIDADGDNKPDTLDVALYARVVGEETVALPNAPPVTAVRVDTFLLSRITYSGNGQVSAVQQAVVQTWYAKGIGIVRQRATTPSSTVNDVEITDELLVSWDGVTRGFGAMAPVSAVVAASSPVFAGQALRTPSHVFAFADRVLAFTPPPNAGTGVAVARLDLRGNVLSSSLLPSLSLYFNDAVTANANGVAVLSSQFLQPQTPSMQLAITRLDTEGALVGAAGAVTINLAGTRFLPVLDGFQAALDGNTLWVLWRRTWIEVGVAFVHDLVLRPFALDGTALSPEMLLSTSQTANTADIAITAGGGRALLVWTEVGAGNPVKYTAVTQGSVPTVRTLADGLTNSFSFITPLLLPSGGALLWPAQPGSGVSLGSSGGIRLDGQWQPVSAGVSLDQEQIAGTRPFDGGTAGASSLASRIVLRAHTTGQLWPDDTDLQQNIDVLSWLDTGAQPLASTPANTVRYPSNLGSMHLVFGDRVLVFGGSSGLMSTTVVWLNR